MKSRFVTSLAVLAIIVGVLGIFSGAIQMLSLRSLLAEPEMAPIVLEAFQEKFGMTLTSEEMQRLLMRNGLSTLVTSVLSIVLGVALKRRLRWSRPAAIYMIFFLTLGMVVSMISRGFRPEIPLYWAGWGLTVVAIFLHTSIILRLRSPEVRAEFQS